MEPKDIQQMFRDAADLRKMGPFDENRKAVEERYAAASARYNAECLSLPPPRDERPAVPDWKSAMAYLAGLLQQMDAVAPETAPMNKAAWSVIAPAVQAYYGKGKTEKNEEPAE